jgi:hypothetical protein
MRVWKGKLRRQYTSFEEFAAYSEVYGLAERLGFKSAGAAWAANPTVQGSTDPRDYKAVSL